MGFSLNIGGVLRKFEPPLVMGILNLTPDSFFSGSRAGNNVLERVEEMLSEGMDILDLGAVSTRPGATEVGAEEEWRRLGEPLAAITKAFPELIVSVDTFRAGIAARAADCGALILNDVSGGGDPEMFATAGRLQLPYVLTHTGGSEDSVRRLSEKMQKARMSGVHDIILDPGFGFGKNVDENYRMLAHLRDLKQALNLPLLVGVSRKSMLYKPLGISPEDALNATTAVHILALENGADILRVHDVKQAVECIKIHTRYRYGKY